MSTQETKIQADPSKNREIDEYIQQWPPLVQERMNQTRQLIHETVPEVTERFSWAMPTFQYEGKNLCHFAGFKQHLGFFPGPDAIIAFAEELKPYHTSKGTIQFQYDEEMPFELIEKIVLHAKINLIKIAEEKEQQKERQKALKKEQRLALKLEKAAEQRTRGTGL